MRIMPEVNEDINEEWLSDKSRFVWDGLARQRLDKPYVRVDGRLKPASWGEAFEAVKAALSKPRITSYNVCYTKLLRFGARIVRTAKASEPFGAAAQDCPGNGDRLDIVHGRRAAIEAVITSYSIHYTKLYETTLSPMILWNRPVSATRPGARTIKSRSASESISA